MRLDALVTERHYLRHLAPVWHELPHDLRGTISDHLEPGRDPVLVASYQDYRRAAPRPVILMEHGAGQTYHPGRHPAYAGGTRRERVILFLNPSQRVAELNAARYPHTPSVAVGAPVLDAWHRVPPRPDPGVVAVTWHWPAGICPESGTAFDEYVGVLPELARTHHLLGHAHPRMWPRVAPLYERFGIEPAPTWELVMSRASMLVGDNSSMLYEFASTGRPVILVNSKRWRRSLTQLPRFWDDDLGPHVNTPRELAPTVTAMLGDAVWPAERRAASVARVYATTAGDAAQRARAAIVEVLSNFDPDRWQAPVAGDPFRPRTTRITGAATQIRPPDTTTLPTALTGSASTTAVVPSGTADTILGWVGDDPHKAAAALQLEQQSERPRSSLVSRLQRLTR